MNKRSYIIDVKMYELRHTENSRDVSEQCVQIEIIKLSFPLIFHLDRYTEKVV